MATSSRPKRCRLMNANLALDMIFQEGSDEEEFVDHYSDSEYEPDDDLLSDVNIHKSRPRSGHHHQADRASTSSSSDSEVDRADDEDESERQSLDLYESDEIREAADQDQDDENTWVKNVRGFPQIPPFQGDPGIKADLGDDPTASQIFRLIIPDTILDLWKEETNRYARSAINEKKRTADRLSPRSKYSLWKPVTRNEMKKFLAICMHMGLARKPTITDYWTNHPALHSSFTPKLMPRERFTNILSFFHVANNEALVAYGEPNHDPLHKIRNFVDHLNDIFKTIYVHDRNVCIDEAMCPFKGRSRFKMYMKDKPVKWGFKFYELCESRTGFVHSFEMFCGDKRLSNKPTDVVMRMMEPLLDKGYRLYFDNYYCCPELCRKLLDRNTMSWGTVWNGETKPNRYAQRPLPWSTEKRRFRLQKKWSTDCHEMDR